MFTFIGRSEHNLDEKGRLTIPLRQREGLDGGYFLTHGLEPCLWLWPSTLYHQLTAPLSQSSILDESTRQFEQLFFGDAVDGKVDSQGRITVPPELREAAGIPDQGAVVIVGARNRIELWSHENWQAHLTRLRGAKAQIAEPLRGIL
jgi:MraZ protein